MSGDDALGGEMQRLGRSLDGDPLALDQGTADRLLAGSLDPADAPPAYAPVAKVLAAAAGPPRPEELAGEAEALALFAAAGHGALSGRRARRRRLARVTVIAAAMLGVLSVSGAVFAAGGLPQTGAWIGRAVQSVVGPSQPTGAPTTIAAPGSSTSTSVRNGQAPGQAPVPGATQRTTGPPTREQRLCTAWQAGNGSGRRMDATAFQALAAAAGGAEHIPAYCRDLQPGGGNGDGKGKGEPKPGKGSGHGDPPDPPDPPGQGSQGGPSGSGGPHSSG